MVDKPVQQMPCRANNAIDKVGHTIKYSVVSFGPRQNVIRLPNNRKVKQFPYFSCAFSF
jgi:hypothetical protein